MQVPPVRYTRARDGVRLAYCTWGSGPAVTWVASTQPESDALPRDLQTSHMPRVRLLRGLTAVRRGVLYDGRGVGASDRDISHATLDDHVADLQAVLEAAGVSTTALAAFHWGVPVAVAAAAHFPAQVCALILWEPSLTGHAAFPVSRALYAGGDILTYEVFSEQVGRLRAPLWGLSPREAAQVFRKNLNVADWSLLHSERRRTFDVRGVLSRVRCPTVVFHDPDLGAVGFDEGTRLLASSVPDCEVQEISGLQLAEISQLASAFLDRVNSVPEEEHVGGNEAERAERRRDHAPTGGLTARELGVLREVARGRSNRQVGEVLGIAPTTVARHVTNILRKIDKTNRVEATRWAIERGLTREDTSD